VNTLHSCLPPIAQNPDVRFLGKLLGDVIRAHEGPALFERIESIRAASVERHRRGSTRQSIVAGLDSLTLDETTAFVRSFMLFSMLANLAEDRHSLAAEPEGTLALAVESLAAHGIDRAAACRLLDAALIMPVLTAHPTQVMRKSMLDHRHKIAFLKRHRGGERDPRVREGIQLSINAIATALRNSG
jgi:phosphoenolpyruvate carboxylase